MQPPSRPKGCLDIDRARFLWLAASLAACSGPADVPPVEVAAPSDVVPTSREPLAPPEPAPAPAPAPIAGDGSEELRRLCRELKPPPGPHCESFEDTRADCEAFADVLEEEAARRATTCLTRRSGNPSICRSDAVEECFAVAVRSASPDPGASDRCRALVGGCSGKAWSSPELSLQTCARAFAAVSDDREALLVSCIAEGCGISGCIWQLSDG